jgi:hypothetical protein
MYGPSQAIWPNDAMQAHCNLLQALTKYAEGRESGNPSMKASNNTRRLMQVLVAAAASIKRKLVAAAAIINCKSWAQSYIQRGIDALPGVPATGILAVWRF